MKIPNIVLTSMVATSLVVGCKNDKKSKNLSIKEIEKIRQDSIEKAKADLVKEIGQNCPACGMG